MTLDRLSDEQRALVERWLPDAEPVADLSWGLIDTWVSRVRSGGTEYIVKAAGPGDHHLQREITAHETATAPLVELGRAPRLVAADRAARVLVTEYLPGRLLEGDPSEYEPETHRQAGRLLAAFHASASRVDEDYERAETSTALTRLSGYDGLDDEVARRARAELVEYQPRSVTLVPTHGDWQPRNWLIHDGVVSAIDFGRFGHRPAETDLARLAAQQWVGRPELERAFFEGYGSDPRDRERWRILRLREAIGTAVWARQVGDDGFERQGIRMLSDALDDPRGTRPGSDD